MNRPLMVHKVISVAIDGALATAGAAVGVLAMKYIPSFRFSTWVFAIVGVFVAGFGLSKDHKVGSVLAGLGISLTIPALVSLPVIGSSVQVSA